MKKAKIFHNTFIYQTNSVELKYDMKIAGRFYVNKAQNELFIQSNKLN